MIDLNNNRKCSVCGGVTDSTIKYTGDFHCTCSMILTPIEPESISMKEQLIKLAIKKGFKSRVFGDAEITSDLNYYLWLCELQRWLRDEKKIIVYTAPFKDHALDVNDAEMYTWSIWGFGAGISETPELALQAGLKEALNLIKK